MACFEEEDYLALQTLIKWPAKLESFCLHVSGTWHFTLSNLGHMLADHKSTLRHIHITGGGSEDADRFDLTDFPLLESLRLCSRDSLGADCAGRLVAPRLREFTLDLTWKLGEEYESHDGMHHPAEDFLRTFAAVALSRDPPTPCHIQVHMQAEDFLTPKWMRSERLEERYPWDRLADIARDIKPHGMELSYGSPLVSRDQFAEGVEDDGLSEAPNSPDAENPFL